MSKLKTLVRAIKGTSDAIALLESSGVDVDRIVGISNAQGPHAKVLQAAVSELAGALEPFSASNNLPDEVRTDKIKSANPPLRKLLKPAPKKKSTAPTKRSRR
jgi:hypothetical protein